MAQKSPAFPLLLLVIGVALCFINVPTILATLPAGVKGWSVPVLAIVLIIFLTWGLARLTKSLYLRVMIGLAIGIILGFVLPGFAKELKPLGTGFIGLIRMLLAPIIFGTVVVGIAKMGDMKKVGRVGVKALVYFEALTTLALIIGLIMVHLFKPGVGMNVDPASLAADVKGLEAVGKYTVGASHLSTVGFILNIIPSSVVEAFSKGDILQVLLFSCIFGAALSHMGKKGENVVHFIDQFTHGLFQSIGYIMKLAPLGAMGSIAFAVGSFGGHMLENLAYAVGLMWFSCFLFVIIVLNIIARLSGFSLWKFFLYIKEEFFIVLGTSSSETVLPRMMAKLENAGCAQSVVGLTIPTGYSFNLDGTSIYLTLASVFIAQAMNIDLSFGQEMTILGVLLLTSKGAAAVAGGGFICLAATLSSLHGALPVEGLVLLLGIDWLMSNARALTNLIGNGVGTIVVSNWEKALDKDRLRRVLSGETDLEASAPEEVMISSSDA